jgi:hypothetical protein
MSKFIRGGVPRDYNLGGFTFHAAEGENALIKLSGRGGPMHLAGDSDVYKESNPQLGGFNQVLSCDNEDFANLRTLQDSNEKITGYVTMPDGTTYNLFGGISNDDALELDNGTVSVEFSGNVEEQ